MRVIIHRNELNVILKKLDSDVENKATKIILSEVVNLFLAQTSQNFERNQTLKRTTFCNKLQQLQNFFCHSKVQQKLSHPNLDIHLVPLFRFNLKIFPSFN